ncbi:MAG: AmmeMemoRadiSam system protein A [Elusimicrobia bacterium]|jgi:AmmeMemoRadiSam system protein A|nr:AmmeMemoRadiSam system protein A [Elusimicrobiota bacterium]
MGLTKDQKLTLLDIVEVTLQKHIKKEEVPRFDITDKTLNGERGVFVTLHKDGRLRGCIGNIFPVNKLYIAVKNMAVAASSQDPRFSSVSPEELGGLDIEISVLTVPEKVKSTEDIKLGRDGVIIKRGMNQGVYLPQVADETGWSKEEFLRSLSYSKAGLEPDAWKDKDTEILTFRAEVFSRKDLNR